MTLQPLSGAEGSTDRPPRNARDRPGRREPSPEATPGESTSPLLPTAGWALRLVVEARADGSPLYLWIDRSTGAVAHRMAAEDLETIGQDPDYVAGAWVDTSA